MDTNIAAAPQLQLYYVILDWNPADPSEGDCCVYVWAKDDESAVKQVAEEMADSGADEFDTDQERQAYVDNIISGAGTYAAVVVANDLPGAINLLLEGPAGEMTPEAKEDYTKVMKILANYGISA